MPGPFDPAAGRLSGQVSASNSKTRAKGTANGMALRAVFYPAFPRWANLCRASRRRCRRQLLRVKRRWWVGGMPVARRSLRERSDRREILEYVSDFFSRSKVAFAKRKNSCTEEWARAKTGGHAYRRGTVLVLGRRDDLGGYFGELAGGRASKSAPFKKEGANLPARAFPHSITSYFSHPLQFAQHSAESQQDAFAAFTAPAKPSAITAINTTALIFFMDFSPLKNQLGFCQPMAMPSAMHRGKCPR